MSTDFSYGGKQIITSGPIKPNGKDMPSDVRTRVESYADIASIPNPYVGLKITVKVDETNNNKMTDYIVKSLKANSFGAANSLVDEVVRYVDYLGVSSSGGGTGAGLTTEQTQQLQTAYEHSQSDHVSMDEVNQAIANAQLSGGEVDLSAYATKTYADNAISTALDGRTFKFLTQAEYDALTTKDPLVEYHITDATNNNIDTSNLASNLSLTGTKLQLKNSQGNLIGNAVTLPSTGGESLNPSDYYTKIELDEKIEKIVVSSGGGSSEILPNVVLFGDSITDPNANGEWFKVIRNYATFKSLKNYARGYCTWAMKSDTEYNIADTSDANVPSNVIWNQYNRMVHDIESKAIEKPDCIIILCGGNDALMNLTIGDVSTVFNGNAQSNDVKTLTNTVASIRYVCELIANNYPTTQLILTTPLQLGTTTYNERIYLVRDAIKKCCEKLAIKVIDQTVESGVYQYRESLSKYYLKDDNIHLTPAGGDRVARYLAREFKNKINDRYIGEGGSSTVVNVESISLDKTSASIISGNSTVLTATISPTNATNQNVNWSSSSNDVTLIPNGLSCSVTSSVTGVYTITVTASDGGSTAKCTLSVIAEGSSDSEASMVKYLDFRDGDNESRPTTITDRIDDTTYTINSASSMYSWIDSSAQDVGWKESGLRALSKNYVYIGLLPVNYVLPEQFTIEACCSIDDVTLANGNNILAFRKSWTDMLFQVVVLNGVVKIQNGGNNSAEGNYTFVNDTLYHFCVTYDGTNVRLLINGEEVIPSTKFAKVGSSTEYPLSIFNNSNVNNAYLSGLYCYFKLYNTVLSDEDIQANYATESALRTMDR